PIIAGIINNHAMQPNRQAPIEMRGAEFKHAGYRLIDQIADFIDDISGKPVTTNAGPGEIRRILGVDSLPQQGRPAGEIVNRASDLLFGYSLLNGHPKFLG